MVEALASLVSAQALRHPSAAAVVEGDGTSLTYQELSARSDALAWRLRHAGVGTGDRVCLLVPKSAAAIVAMLAVLKCGGAYVPIDCASPAERARRILDQCDTPWVLAHPSVEPLCGQLDVRPLWFDDSGPADPFDHAEPNELAYIMFTSGSTGVPKGVPITQESVARFAHWVIGHFGIQLGDRLSAHPSFHFDLSVMDIYGALLAGATLRIVPQRTSLLPNLVARFIRDTRLTQWVSVPSALVAMAQRNVVAHNDFPDLRRIMWCGDVMPAATLRHLMDRLPHVSFTNLYGPTETTVASTFHPITEPPDDSAIPIGRPIPGEQVAVLDDSRQPVPVDEVGDLYISGDGLSTGYWRAPELTAAAFLEIPPGSGRIWYRTGDRGRLDAAGVLHFHGRTDRQVKSAGHRIELDEVAVAVNTLTGVAHGAVVAVPVAGFEGVQLCAAYVPALGTDRQPADLHRELAGRLPAYMLPARWLRLDDLPRNINGKIDHQALAALFPAEED